MQFPTIVYKIGGNHFAANGKTYSYLGVKNQAEFDKLIAAGWFATMAEALEGKTTEAVKAEDSAPVTRLELETKANELGIRFDGRTPDGKLGKLIQEKLGE